MSHPPTEQTAAPPVEIDFSDESKSGEADIGNSVSKVGEKEQKEKPIPKEEFPEAEFVEFGEFAQQPPDLRRVIPVKKKPSFSFTSRAFKQVNNVNFLFLL